MRSLNLSTLLFLIISFLFGIKAQQQHYYEEENPNDDLYQNYADREKMKEVQVGTPWGKLAATGALGWFMGGKFHSSKLQKKLNAKHKEETKALYTTYYSDVYGLKETNAQLVAALEQMGVTVKTQ